MTEEPEITEAYSRVVSFLIETRHKRGLTQTQLGEMLAKPQSYIAKYELLTRRLDVVEFMEICEALGLRPSKVMVLAQ